MIGSSTLRQETPTRVSDTSVMVSGDLSRLAARNASPPWKRVLLPDARGPWPVLRLLALAGVYALVFAFSFLVAYELRFDFAVPGPGEGSFQERRFLQLPMVIALKVLAFWGFGQFRGMLSYFRLPDAQRILAALALSSGVLLALWYTMDPLTLPPRGVILADFLISLCLVGGGRLGLRLLRERYLSEDGQPGRKVQRVAILGAGNLGATIASEFLSRRNLGLRPVVFLDDDFHKWHQVIHGIKVAGSPEQLGQFKVDYAIDRLILAMPSASEKRLRQIVALARKARLPAETVPSLGQITAGKVRVNRLRPVEIEDLLGREPAQLDSEGIREMVHNRAVLVTGAGGSIGRELCRQIAALAPSRLLMVERSEGALFETDAQLHADGHGALTTPIVGDILDASRMEEVFTRHRPQLVFHAAAHKHVPIMEGQPGEAIRNNAIGTARLAELAAAHEVERFVFISTDKAINPTSVMGATKRLAELYVQSRQSVRNSRTRFLAVRFGNVLGSSNSVVPIFRQQIANGGPVTVTHPEITRYFMTIAEAVGLVLECALRGTGGEIFMLDMGKPIRIIDLARNMIELSGFRPDIDIEIRVTGLRPGEKLYEELRYSEETHESTEHPRINRLRNHIVPYERMQEHFRNLEDEIATLEAADLKVSLKRYVVDYQPFLEP